MSRKAPRLLLSIAVALLLPACATHELSTRTLDKCKANGNTKSCKLQVEVTEDREKQACAVKVELRDIAFPPETKKKNLVIAWELTGAAGYKFPANGIAIDENIPPDFDKPEVKDHGKTFRWRNKNSLEKPKSYYYAIHVENSDGTITCYEDPRINNQ